MKKYDYLKAVTADAKKWLLDNYEEDSLMQIIECEDYYDLYDIMFSTDSVTGNGSGSYTSSTWEAEENLCHNWDLMKKANNEIIGLDNVIISDSWEFGPKYWDVAIRCYLLREAIERAIEEIKHEREKK